MRNPKLWALVLLVALVAAAGLWWLRRGEPAPLRRIPPKSLTFPAAVLQPTPLQRVRAFPQFTFRRPVFLTAAPGETDVVYVVEQAGRILVFENDDGVAAARVFLDITDRVSRDDNEEGLLGLAFSPDYSKSRTFYIYYSATGERRTVLSRFRAADPSREEVLLEIDQPFGNHNGGMIAFGKDGMLYVGVGDGGAGGDPFNHAQDLETLLGSILRIDPRGGAPYAIPADNPFAGVDGARAEIWAYGLRNPWRFSFDEQGRLWAGDVGQNAWEEIDLIEKGRNYGWSIREGDRRYKSVQFWRGMGAGELAAPVVTYAHDPIASVTGGYVYRGAAVPAFLGHYFYGDFVSGDIWALHYEDGGVVSNHRVARVPSLSSFGEDGRGELHAVSLSGAIYRFVPTPRVQRELPFPQRLSETGIFSDTAGLAAAPGLVPFDVNAPLWSDGASKRRWIALPEGTRIAFHPVDAWTFPVGTVLVKHFELGARRLETRVLIHAKSGWAGYVYKWNEAQTDAFLLDGGLAEEIVVDGRRQTWAYPSREDCLKCHTEAAGHVLGVRTRQLNRRRAYGDRDRNQLDAWNEMDFFRKDIGDPAPYEAYPDPADEDAPVAARARAYLAVNCAVCHLPGGPAPGNMDLRYATPLPAMRVVGVAPVETEWSDHGGLLVQPGAGAQSLLWRSMRATGPRRMPPLASHVVDASGSAVVAAWIDGLER